MAKMKRDSSGSLLFECPCGELHVVYPHGCDSPNPARWSWNGSVDAPTLSPSILVSWPGPDDRQNVCHSFITDGRIQFCGDCTHELAGQTVELPDWVD
ncbi:ammonia monooxygenase [Burkholderia sp. LA-2-3-30-S1-D2]|nr:ammonia monooxygenase [Burkholderia sp. LA-2-3-30-S1-D2]KVE14976.1 ammonia monooxygenase [Burkholderia sp. LA-2-3-30-S1-D2]